MSSIQGAPVSGYFDVASLPDAFLSTEMPVSGLEEVDLRIAQARYAQDQGQSLNYYELFFGASWREKLSSQNPSEFASELSKAFAASIESITAYTELHEASDLDVDGVQLLQGTIREGFRALSSPDLRKQYDLQLAKIERFWKSAPTRITEHHIAHHHLADRRSLHGAEARAGHANWESLLDRHGSPQITEAFPELVPVLGMIKEANIQAMWKLGDFQDTPAVVIPGQTEPVDPKKVYQALIKACREFRSGDLSHHFNLSMLQGGAGTSINMTANEIIAHRANMHLYAMLGVKIPYNPDDLNNPQVHLIHPNNHVNFPNSTNDVLPTAISIATYIGSERVVGEFRDLAHAFTDLSQRKDCINCVKAGRTHLQTAVPMTLSREFAGWASLLTDVVNGMERARRDLLVSTLGANAIGTGINTGEGYNKEVAKQLSRIMNRHGHSSVSAISQSELTKTTFSQFDVLQFHATLKNGMVQAGLIADAFRMYGSSQYNEFRLPAKQAGSSIMPGKVNPTMAEIVNQATQVIVGNDVALTQTATAAQLQLQVFDPATIHTIASSLALSVSALERFRTQCVEGLEFNFDAIRRNLIESTALSTALNPILGYKAVAEVVRAMNLQGENPRTILEVLNDDSFMDMLCRTYDLPKSKIGESRDALREERWIEHTAPRARVA